MTVYTKNNSLGYEWEMLSQNDSNKLILRIYENENADEIMDSILDEDKFFKYMKTPFLENMTGWMFIQEGKPFKYLFHKYNLIEDFVVYLLSAYISSNFDIFEFILQQMAENYIVMDETLVKDIEKSMKVYDKSRYQDYINLVLKYNQ